MNEKIYQNNFNKSIFKIIKNRYNIFLNDKLYIKIIKNYDKIPIIVANLKRNKKLIKFLEDIFSLIQISIKYCRIIKIDEIIDNLNLILKFIKNLKKYINGYYKNIINKYIFLYDNTVNSITIY